MSETEKEYLYQASWCLRIASRAPVADMMAIMADVRSSLHNRAFGNPSGAANDIEAAKARCQNVLQECKGGRDE